MIEGMAWLSLHRFIFSLSLQGQEWSLQGQEWSLQGQEPYVSHDNSRETVAGPVTGVEIHVRAKTV